MPDLEIVIQFAVGICVMLSLGWLVWNGRLLWYRFWCWLHYNTPPFLKKRTHKENK